ncbi:MAG: protein kinase [Planctomycetota bacterium]
MKQTHLTPDQLTDFLNGNLADRDEQVLTQHLDECSTCAESLQRLAADDVHWQQAGKMLGPSPTLNEIHQTTASLPLSTRQVLELLGPTDDPKSMGRLGSFEVIGVIGSGAMGVVLKAEDPTLDRIVAVKVMNPSLASSGVARVRFEREAKAAAAIQHSNVVAIHSVSEFRDVPYLVMPLVKGESLQRRIDRNGPSSLTELLRIGYQIAAALAAAHRQGVIHRDIKPSNILVAEGVEKAMLADFGLARAIDDATMTRSGTITGTPEYMSPEQARGEVIGFSSDLFGLGSVLYALAAGHAPFRAQTTYGVIRRIIDTKPIPVRQLNPEFPEWLDVLIDKLHAKDPEERPSADQTVRWLEDALAHVNQPQHKPLPVELMKPPSQPSFPVPRLLLAVGSFVVIAFFSFFVFAMPVIWNDNEVGGVRSTAETDSVDKETFTTSISKDPAVFREIRGTFPNPDQVGKLIVDINRGFVEVTGHNSSEVVIEVLNPMSKLTKKGEAKTLFAPNYDFDVSAEDNSVKLDTYNYDYNLNLRIKVPRQSNLEIDNYYYGYLKIENIEGQVDAESQHDDISLLGISGGATAYSRNGSLEVSFDKLSPDAKLDFESYNGYIKLTLPKNAKLSTAISSGTGSIVSAFDLEPIDKRDSVFATVEKLKESEYQFGLINGGGTPIRIENAKSTTRILKNKSLRK